MSRRDGGVPTLDHFRHYTQIPFTDNNVHERGTWHGHRYQPPLRHFALFQRERIFRFHSTERANREPASGVFLQVFDVGLVSEARFFERLHRAMALFATHDLIAFCEGFLEGAWEPTPTHLHLALRHHRRFFPGSH